MEAALVAEASLFLDTTPSFLEHHTRNTTR